MARTKQTARKSTGGKAPRKQLCGYREPSPRPHGIWDIPEIVENILVQLPMENLLFSQTVCSYWRTLICDSPRLQEALFYRPQSIPVETDEDQEVHRTVNPLLARKFSAWFACKPGRSYDKLHFDKSVWTTTKARLVLLRSDASWRRMLTCQPPLMIWEEAHACHQRSGDSLYSGSLSTHDGVRMGLVYDHTELAFQEPGTIDFYMISDGSVPVKKRKGRATAAEESGYLSDPSKTEDRIFGGKDTLTLVVWRGRGCGGAEPSRHDQTFVSTDYEKVGVEMKSVESRSHGGGRAFSWFTKDGFHKYERT